ncbi:hypothetical protein DXG01_001009 [Tephrocybe rancida]|nr:hypothetical protein DXG01_001009 [Tephrocybe rancida]
MLAQLASISGVKLRDWNWNVHFDAQEEGSSSSSTAEDALVIDLHSLRSLIPPHPDLGLQHFATGCVYPAYFNLQRTIKDDLGHIIEVLSSLEISGEGDTVDSIPEDVESSADCPLNLVPSPLDVVSCSQLDNNMTSSSANGCAGYDCMQEDDHPPEQCQRPSKVSIPTIVVSPCAPPEYHMTCRVPIQDNLSAFALFMTLKALFYAYVLGGITFIPLVLAGLIFFTIYTSVPVGDADVTKKRRGKLEAQSGETDGPTPDPGDPIPPTLETDDIPRTRKGWLTMRRTFEESSADGGYVTIMRSFLDARSKDPKRSRPKDMWFVVLKGTVLYLYEDEEMTECEAAIELGGHDVVVFPEGLLDGELFAKRNAICLKPKKIDDEKNVPSVTKEMALGGEDIEAKVEKKATSPRRQEKERDKLLEAEKSKQAAREEALDPSTPWFIFVRSNIEMEDWYLSLIHASTNPSKTPSLAPLQPIFLPSDMHHLVSTLDEQPDVIPTRWLNALIGRVFFSYYRTHRLEHYIIGRLMKKLSKVKRPNFLTDIVVTEVSVGNKAPTVSKPMLKELTKEGDASMEVHFQYKGEFRITIEATAMINIGTFKSYTVKLALAAVLKELEGNLLVKIKRPPSARIWYAFTQAPRMVLEVEPIVSDRQITWSMILSTIEARLKEIIHESIVMPNMDDIAFFDSLKFAHRGGIWEDASRHEKPNSPLPDADVVDETASALVTDGTPIVEEAPQISQSAEELTAPAEPSVLPLPPPLIERHSAPAEDETWEETRSTDKRRRSWFSSVRSEGSTARKGIFPDPDDDVIDGSLQRGRSTEPDKASLASSRSRSTPQNSDPSVPNSRDSTPDSDESSLLNTHLMPHTPRRSSSQHSSKRDHTKSLSTDSSKSAPDPETATARKTSGGLTSPNSATSFLSTLKSRAGDKQALSNTAKEAMRKWGVNWGTRKDTSGDDSSDHGSIGSAISSRLRPDTTFGVATKARASYAEVRAAVAERKGKSAGTADDGSDHSRSSSPSTLPVPIPQSRGKTRSTSNPRSSPELAPPDNASASSYPESVTLSTSAHSASSSSSKRLSVGGGEATSGGSRKSSPSVSRSTTEGEGVTTQPSKPIHNVQPTAKTMTIPGIHASHRGEIMSMGYVAPPQPPTMNPSEAKSSSIYRLFKTPASTGSGSLSGSTHGAAPPPASSAQQPAPQTSTSSQDAPVTSNLNEPSRDNLSLTPPQPSANVASAVSTASSTSPSTASLQSPNPRVPPPLPPRSPAQARPQVRSIPSAEEALKSIASKDAERSRPPSFENGRPSAVTLTHTSGNGNELDGLNGSLAVTNTTINIDDTHAGVDGNAPVTGNGTTDPASDLDRLREQPIVLPSTPKKPFIPNPNAPPLPPRRPQVREAQS